MSVESARAFCMRLMADDEFRDSLGKAASPEAIAEIMKKENYDFSQHDLLKNLLLRFIKRGQRLLQIDVLPLHISLRVEYGMPVTFESRYLDICFCSRRSFSKSLTPHTVSLYLYYNGLPL